MTRIYIKLIMCIITIAGLAISLSPLVGRLRSANPVLDGFYQDCEGQPQPCWYGIRPGVTLLDDALRMVKQTHFVKMIHNDYVVTLVYRNATMRCGVELRTKAHVVDTVTIINCLDKQMGDVVRTMRHLNHKLPFSMGMLDAVMNEEVMDSYDQYVPCLGYTPYGQIIGMPLGISEESTTMLSAGWHDFLPRGWYVHAGGSFSCDLVNSSTNTS